MSKLDFNLPTAEFCLATHCRPHPDNGDQRIKSLKFLEDLGKNAEIQEKISDNGKVNIDVVQEATP